MLHKILKISILELLISLTVINCQTSKTTQSIDTLTKSSDELSELSTAYFASGCFWCVEAIYESVEGVSEAVSGYAGGQVANPTYQLVGSHKTRHAEVVQVFYKPEIVSYETLVKVFYGSQDPTTVGQKPDFGDSYRSIIFYQNDNEKAIAEAAKTSIASQFSDPIVTEIVPFVKFWKGEDYHQNYEKLNPNQSYVRNVSIPRLNRFKVKFPELLKEGH